MDPSSYKLAAFQVELNIIKQIAVNNRYTSHLIDKMVEKNLLKKASVLVYPLSKNFSPQKCQELTYIGRKFQIKFLKTIKFETNNSSGKNIRNNKCKTLNQTGAYQLNCGSCEDIQFLLRGLKIEIR